MRVKRSLIFESEVNLDRFRGNNILILTSPSKIAHLLLKILVLLSLVFHWSIAAVSPVFFIQLIAEWSQRHHIISVVPGLGRMILGTALRLLRSVGWGHDLGVPGRVGGEVVGPSCWIGACGEADRPGRWC